MDTSKLKKFAQSARRDLIGQVTTKLKLVLASDSVARREAPKAVEQLQKQMQASSEEQVIEQIAYTWFNRFCAFRYMDVNRYARVGVVSPTERHSQPEILAEAKMGHVDESMILGPTRDRLLGLIEGSIPSADPQGEVYRLLLVAACNSHHKLMPFMFERIADYTELLIPDDLLSESSILTATREALTPEACQSVETIGWLYQFYISEKKDNVFAALKKGKKITPENIPAATQLFTPHWIVRYLVENSLGRLWMLNHPDSRLIEQMDYYIQPEEPETDFLRITSPEEIKICDPACGSGHMLTYAFDLLYAIYEEQGHQATDIPRLILTHNLYGIEIDQRAGALAAFALTMKAREKYRRFLQSSKVVQPNICVLENIQIDPEDLSAYMDKVGRDLFTDGLQGVVNQWEEADNFGSLIRPLVTDVSEVLELLRERQMGEDLFLAGVHQKVLKALRQADFLSPKYHVVVANPPYMGSGGMNPEMKEFAAVHFDDAKSDLFAMFLQRSFDFVPSSGMVSMITMHSWMFLSTLEEVRRSVLRHAVHTMTHLGERAFDTIGGAVVATTAFVVGKDVSNESLGKFIRLVDGDSEAAKIKLFMDGASNRFTCNCSHFLNFPSAIVAYWATPQVEAILSSDEASLGDFVKSEGKNVTTKNEKFIRYWWEVESKEVGNQAHWFPIAMGGDYRKWSGNLVNAIDWSPSTRRFYREATAGRIIREEFWAKSGVTWGKIGTDRPSFRFLREDEMYQETAVLQDTPQQSYFLLGALNSCTSSYLLTFLSPTINFQLEDIKAVPLLNWHEVARNSSPIVEDLVVEYAKDWDSQEFSYRFQCNAFWMKGKIGRPIDDWYSELRREQMSMISKCRELESSNNRIFIEAYGLADEISPEVALEDVTLSCNPNYRYDDEKSDSELKALFLADTMREFISYAVGCMLGRYSLDKPGLILANQGETADDYRQQIPEPTFAPDEDNVIPLLDGDWFTDDITERFKAFLKVTFGTEHFEENLTFLENALYPDNLTGKKRKTIRDYFLKEFYNHHIKLYKKRPIYWLFSSPKGTFNVLIYMHRYRPDTVSIVLNDYLREYQDKLAVRKKHVEATSISTSAARSEKTKALKEMERINKVMAELKEYEQEVLYPLATQQIEIDLDDGVKVNYKKFGVALKKVVGLS